MRKLPGIDIPIATEANILHAAAYLEFKHHVERLVRDRHDTAAYTCWMHAVEVGHSPFVLPTTTEIAPSAYRFCPMAMLESLGCVVVWFHQEWQEPAYQVYAGLLFGLPLAVTSFNRFSRLVEALSRRLCRTLVSLYFDDATITGLGRPGSWTRS